MKKIALLLVIGVVVAFGLAQETGGMMTGGMMTGGMMTGGMTGGM